MAFWENSFNGSYGGNYRLRVNVDIVQTDIASNRTLIRYNCWWEKTGSGSTYNGNTTYGNTNINGHNPQRAMGGYNMNTTGQRIYLAQNEDYWIGHDGNGYANPYFGANYNTGTVGSSSTGGNFTMPHYDLYLGYHSVTIDEITDSSMRVRLHTDWLMDRYAYSLNGGGNWTEVGFEGSDVTFTITGLAAYTTYNLRFSVRKLDSKRWSEHGNHQRTTLGYAKILTHTYSNVTDTTATMSLTTDAAIKTLKQQYRKVGDTTWTDYPYTLSGNATSATVNMAGLLPDQDYELRTIVTRSDSGLDTTSTTQTIKTLASNKFFGLGDF